MSNRIAIVVFTTFLCGCACTHVFGEEFAISIRTEQQTVGRAGRLQIECHITNVSEKIVTVFDKEFVATSAFEAGRLLLLDSDGNVICNLNRCFGGSFTLPQLNRWSTLQRNGVIRHSISVPIDALYIGQNGKDVVVLSPDDYLIEFVLLDRFASQPPAVARRNELVGDLAVKEYYDWTAEFSGKVIARSNRLMVKVVK